MTAIAGLVHDGKVYIGGDSASVAGSDFLRVSKVDKVFTNGPFLIGITGSWRFGQLLRYALEVPPQYEGQSAEQYMVTTFVDAVRQTLKAGGHAEQTEHQQERPDGSALIGYRGRLFSLGGDYQINENAVPFDAAGCGDEYALGSLYSTAHMADPEERIRTALAAAEEFASGVRGPFVVKSI